ncbi:MAG: pyrroline-5-carboxylate reductase [Candidatus Omnitrophica bacterium]|nr:pyrroline-5-carboxylate reductase [Candidatus Omnitrophota bacterium]
MNKTIAFIGCGNMGEALLRGLIGKGLFRKSSIMASELSSSRRRYIKKTYRIKLTSSNKEAAAKSDIVILAVKPQNMQAVLKELEPVVKKKLIISIAAGITTDFIKDKTGAKRILRVMPNAPALIGCGITAISSARGVSRSDVGAADKIFSCVGEVVHLKESQMDAVTAVSGSGPAYFYLLMEAMMEAALACGLDKRTAEKLVLETAFGSALLQYNCSIHPSKLRKRVTSKGGTTEAALKVFEKRGFAGMVKAVVKAAAKRAKELSR